MPNTTSPVGRIVDAAKRIVDAVTPDDAASNDKRGPIPATAPPGLKKAGDAAKHVATTTARTARDAATKTARTAKGAAGATVDTARRAAGRAGKTAREGAKKTRTTADTAREEAEAGKPGRGVSYEEWTKADLYERAQELDISGRSSMNKGELIDALRDHS